MVIGCEVEVLRDNGYGKLSYSKKLSEVSTLKFKAATLQRRPSTSVSSLKVNVTVIDSQGHNLNVRKGKWDGSDRRSSGVNDHEAIVGQPLRVSCVSRGADPSPNLTLTINDQPWLETSSTAKFEPVTLGVPNGYKVVEGRLDMVYDSMFNNNGYMVIECKAFYDDYLFEKEHTSLTKRSPNSQV